MRRADRLLSIIQFIRRYRRAVPAKAIADAMEVSIRTIYRDIITLQASGVPITGEAGVGYLLDDGYELPPLMFTPDELETIMLALRLVKQRGDEGLQENALDVEAKIFAVLPSQLRPVFLDTPLIAPKHSSNEVIEAIDIRELRLTLKEHKKIHVQYCKLDGERSERVLWPLSLAYFGYVRVLIAWCELREDYRHFRTDRIERMTLLEERFSPSRKSMLQKWEESDS